MPLLLQLPWPCSEEALARVFVRASSTLRLIFLFSYVFSVLLPKIYPLFVSSGSGDNYEYEQQDESVYGEVEDAAGVDYVEEEEEEVVANDWGYDDYNTSYYYDYNDSTSSMDTWREELLVDDGEETLMFQSSSNSSHHHIESSSFDQEAEDVDEEEDVQKREEIENNGDEEEEEVQKREEIENNGGEEDVQNREETEKYSEEEEEEVVIVEDITGREDSYLDDMEVFDADQVFKESDYVEEDRELEDPSSSIANNNDILHYYNQDDHQQQRGKVVWEIEPASEPWIIRSTEEQKNTETFAAGNYDINSTTDHQFTIDSHHHHHPRVVKQEEEEVMFSTDSGSTSKSSSEWRSSLFTCKDSATTDDPFSSSSRRSCPKWESYTVFQKYDEEMLFLDRISVQKLHETESLKALQSAQPRSISRRIAHHLTSAMTARAKTHTARRRHNSSNNNPYYELEAAYVAQVCLAWEALSWDYDNFKRKQGWIKKQGGSDPGCPDVIAQQFQQFQVLLQRYIENEPYEYGRRPEIYARMRIVFPKLMQVPEYHDYNEEQKDKQVQRIPTATFVAILEDSILTFMNFVKTDTTNRYQLMFSALFRRGHSSNSNSVDPIQLDVMKKINKKKKLKLKEVRRSSEGRCFWACCAVNERKITREEEMVAVMGLIDLKVVTRVLRMGGHNNILTQEQLKWCEAKMAKITFSATTGRVHRDSTPLFFPAH